MFTRDIVVFDTETTGLDISKHEIIQIAGVLLDKYTLDEVSTFSTYIKPSNWEERSAEAMEVNQISYTQLESAPILSSALKEWELHFSPNTSLLAAYNAWFDTGYLRQAYIREGKDMPYEFHTFDIWTLAYKYWCSEPHTPNPRKAIGFGLSDIASSLGIYPDGNFHGALTDARVEAEVLRKLLAKLTPTQ